MIKTHVELEAAYAKATSDWQKASDEVDTAQAIRARTIAAWDRLVAPQHQAEVEQRKADVDRRSTDATWDGLITDNRKADADRRKAIADFAAFSNGVAARHKAYADRSNAEAEWAKAATKLIEAIARREQAKAALEELNRGEGNA